MQTQTKPMLALPMGGQDWKNGHRWDFLQKHLPILNQLGWTIGVELKGKLYDDKLDDWLPECMKAMTESGGRLTWHLPIGATKKLHEGISPELADMAKFARLLKDYGLEAVTIHCTPAMSVDPPEDAGMERYNSPISAEEMLKHVKAQVEPLKELNKLTGNILHIENVDPANFRNGGYRVPTYLQLQTGSRLELPWLKREADINTTFDSEHFFCAGNLLERREEFRDLPTDEIVPDNFSMISGYGIVKGRPPVAANNVDWFEFINAIQPKLFHLGGAIRAIDGWGRIETHLPNFDYPLAKKALDFELRWIAEHPEVIGGVIEVTGQLEPEKYTEWSPRPADDEVAKMQTFLTVMDEIERVQKDKGGDWANVGI